MCEGVDIGDVCVVYGTYNCCCAIASMVVVVVVELW